MQIPISSLSLWRSLATSGVRNSHRQPVSFNVYPPVSWICACPGRCSSAGNQIRQHRMGSQSIASTGESLAALPTCERKRKSVNLVE
jgi:hypothetical protein